MAFHFDVRQVGVRWGVFDVRDNSPVGKTFTTRVDARAWMDELYADEGLLQDIGYSLNSLEKWLEEHKKSRFKFSEQGENVGAGDLNTPKVS
ncbi:hypothetical protein LCGC14_0410340 [marine sediment metagenome]|uniref:Uncharacterized protein n=1 Tax=marine sediment metagenome TaxID=412755 RepID=A0A0F9SU85_9ZZZZ